MFKVLLVVYILGGGGSDHIDNTFGANFVFQEFNSMEDCELAVESMKGLLTWHRSPDGTPDDKKDMVKVFYSTKCVPMTAIDESAASPPPPNTVDVPIIVPETHIPIRKHRRWDD